MEPETEGGRETQLRGAQVKLKRRERERETEGPFVSVES